MHLEKLITVLKSFDESRLKRLKVYASSPYFRIPPVCVLLLERLTPLHPDFPEKKMQWQNIGKKDRTLSTLSKQWNAGSYLLRAVEGFIAQEEWQKDEGEATFCLLKGFEELSLSDEFDNRYAKAMVQLQKSSEANPDIFFERHALTELSFNRFDARLQRTVQNDIMPVVRTLDEFYAIKKLRYLCEALNRNQVLGINYTDEQILVLFKILEPFTNSQCAYVYLFVNVYRMMAADPYEDSDLHYRLLKQFIERQTYKVLPQSICEAADYALNYCLRWSNKGYEEAGNEYLWWIEWKKKLGLLFQNGKLTPVTFRNIIVAAQSQKNTNLMKQLIDCYAPHLPAEHHDTNLCFAKGLYHYSLKNYKQAIRFFLTAQAKEAVFNCIIRRWHWTCLYECDQNDTDTLFNHLDAFEKYLLRNRKELHNKFDAFSLFLQYAYLLLKSGKAKPQELNFNGLENEEHFAGKPWLMQHFAAKNKKPVRIAHG